MNAMPKPATVRTSEDLTAQIAALENNLATARRDHNRVQAALPGLIADGDERIVALYRKEAAESEASAERMSTQLDELRKALQVAKGRERASVNAHSYAALKKSALVRRKELEVLGDSIKAIGAALKAATAGQELFEQQMREAGVMPDPYIIRANLMGITQLALHVASGGLLGERLTLETDEQLRQNGRANLHHAAEQAHVLLMRKIRMALGVMQE